MAFTFSFGGPPVESTVDAENRRRDDTRDVDSDSDADRAAKAEFEQTYGVSVDLDETVGETLITADERARFLDETVRTRAREMGGELGVNGGDGCAIDAVVFDGFRLLKVNVDLDDVALDNEAIATIATRSDLKQGVYEGGFKLWECAVDLGNFLERAALTPADAHLAVLVKGDVLELGCGHGLPGVIALRQGATSVHFLDFNLDVLRLATLPNVYLNTGDDGVARSRFWSGDWLRASALMAPSVRFALVLSSETIYNTGAYAPLLDVLAARLALDGSALFATKEHYFGVGGGVLAFVAAVTADGRFVARTAVSVAGRNAVAREIVELRWAAAADPAPLVAAALSARGRSGKGPAPAVSGPGHMAASS